MVFKAAQTIFERACVGEGERFGDLDDEAVGHELDFGVDSFGVFEFDLWVYDQPMSSKCS